MTVTERAPERIKEDNETRLRRAKSWLTRAESADKLCATHPGILALDNYPVRFVFWWIAFEAAYNQGSRSGIRETSAFIYRTVARNRMSFERQLTDAGESVREIIKLRTVHDGFWFNRAKSNGLPTYSCASEWESDFNEEIARFWQKGVVGRLQYLFKRLRVVRQQIFHGGHSRQRKTYGATQAEHGAKLLKALVPCFIREMELIMKKHPEFDWGEVPFPRQGKPDQVDLPVWAKRR